MTGFALKARTSHPQHPNEQHLSPPVGVIMQVLGKQVAGKHWGGWGGGVETTNRNDMPLSHIARALRLNMAALH